ncbi:MAG: KTSC domain-containing protein, partial [Bacteroidota bacterium]
FVSGAVYEYKKVPLAVVNAMRKATSKGTYLNKHIKGSYSFTKIK